MSRKNNPDKLAGASLQTCVSSPFEVLNFRSSQAQSARVIFLLLFGLIFLFSACDNEDIPDNGEKPEIPTGEMVAVTFTVGGIGYDDDEVNTRSTSADYPPVELRGAIINLDENVIVRIVVYAGLYHDTYAGYADYRVLSGGMLDPLSGTQQSVPTGNNKFVAYSYNSPASMPAFAETTAPIGSQDLMWGDTTATIGVSSSPVHITMNHLMSKVVVRGKTDYLYSLNSVDAGILCYEPTLTVNTGVLDLNGSPVYRPVPWTFANPADSIQVSDTMYVFTDAAATTNLIINQMSVNSVLFTGPYYVNYAKPLEDGNKYTLDLRFSPQPVGGSTARITWEPPSSLLDDGRYVITYDPRDAGLYFMFGSVVGIFSAEGQTRSLIPPLPPNTTFQTPRDVAWSPISIADWTNIPYESVAILIDSVFHTEINVLAGLGDPCRLVDMNLRKIRDRLDGIGPPLNYDDIDNGIWRLPTAQENRDFSGKQIDTLQPNPAEWWWAANAFGNISFGVAGGEFPQRGTGGMSKFLPAAGFRQYDTTSTYYQGSYGYYWSNENGLVMVFYNTALLPATPATQRYTGFSVRCVKQAIEFEIEVNAWEPGGTLSEDIVIY